MNNYELIGRLTLIHQNCEDLFSSCGSVLDKIISDTKSDDETDPSGKLLDLKTKLIELNSELEDYNSVVEGFIVDRIIESPSTTI